MKVGREGYGKGCALEIEQQIVVHGHFLVAQGHRVVVEVGGRCKPSLFFYAQNGFRHYAQHASLIDNHGCIEQAIAGRQGHTYDGYHVAMARIAEQLHQRLTGSIVQQGLRKEVATRSTGQCQLGEEHHLYALLASFHH